MGKAKGKTRKKPNPIPKASPVGNAKSGFFLKPEVVSGVRAMSKEKIVFSFRFFDRRHELFNLGDVSNEWYVGLIDNLKHISELNRNEFIEARQHFDCHPYSWDRLDCRFNMPPEWFEQIMDSSLQFRISTGSGRVHGFMIGNRFYVVWLDPYHNLDPIEGFGGRKLYDPAQNQYEKKCREYEELKEKFAEYSSVVGQGAKKA